MYLNRWIQHSSLNSEIDISLAASRDVIILIHSLLLKFRSLNCLSINSCSFVTFFYRQTLKGWDNYQRYLPNDTLSNTFSENSLQIITKTYVAEFNFS